jgi:hypothetical protein
VTTSTRHLEGDFSARTDYRTPEQCCKARSIDQIRGRATKEGTYNSADSSVVVSNSSKENGYETMHGSKRVSY